MIPLATKKNGTKKPKPTAVSFDSKTCSSCPLQRQAHDHPGDEAPEQQVEAELRGEEDEAEDQHHGHPHRELAARLEGLLQRGQPRQAQRIEPSASDQRQRDEGDQDQRLVQRRWWSRAPG